METGVYLPFDDVGATSRADLDAWLAAVADGGHRFVEVADHVLGMDPSRLSDASRSAWRARWPGQGEPYDHTLSFREPFVTMTYIAARSELSLSTGVIVLPQRQTALVAKQAAEVDLFCGGRLRLGVGVGWNPVEYAGLGVRFADRIPLLEEQISLLRRFWTEPAVSFAGRFHAIEASGILVQPVQRPIPIWIGGLGPRTMGRIGRLADGWLPPGAVDPTADGPGRVAALREAAERAGRDPDTIEIEPRVYAEHRTEAELAECIGTWRELGATHLLLDTRVPGKPTGLGGHVERMQALTAQLPADVDHVGAR